MIDILMVVVQCGESRCVCETRVQTAVERRTSIIPFLHKGNVASRTSCTHTHSLTHTLFTFTFIFTHTPPLFILSSSSTTTPFINKAIQKQLACALLHIKYKSQIQISNTNLSSSCEHIEKRRGQERGGDLYTPGMLSLPNKSNIDQPCQSSTNRKQMNDFIKQTIHLCTFSLSKAMKNAPNSCLSRPLSFTQTIPAALPPTHTHTHKSQLPTPIH